MSSRRDEKAEQGLLQALHHPFRRSLLRRYVEAAEPLSPKDLAELTQEPLSNISYHVRELYRFDVVELVSEKPSHGSVQHFYKATPLVRETPWLLATLGLPET
jgi:DNA-binding transcriptional ArsR family regulator